MKITLSAYNALVSFTGFLPAESGGALFGYENDSVIRHFVPDENAKTTRSSYSFNTSFLNPVIKSLWEEQKLSLLGIAHSRPYGNCQLSKPDRDYFVDLLKDIPRKHFYTPIIHTIPDGGLKVFPYVYEKDSISPKAVELEIVSDDYKKPKEISTPTQKKTEVTNNYVLLMHPKGKETTTKTKDNLLIAVSITIIFCAVFFIALQLSQIFI